MICSKTFLWSLQNSDLSSQQFGIILAKPRCPCVKRSFSILHYTGPVSVDQWEGLNLQNWPMRGEENSFDNCMGWAVTTVTGPAPSQTQTHFPHDQVILSSLNCPRNCDQSEALTASYLPIRGQEIWHLWSQTGLEMTCEMFTAEWARTACRGCCRLCSEICPCHL